MRGVKIPRRKARTRRKRALNATDAQEERSERRHGAGNDLQGL
nr:MAG TPA: hypothetical protein [Caudoviricetes sp.]